CETTSGSFTINSSDGISNVLFFEQTTTHEISTSLDYLRVLFRSTGEGVLTLTGYTGTSFSGTVNYSYTLSATIDNDSKIPTAGRSEERRVGKECRSRGAPCQ